MSLLDDPITSQVRFLLFCLRVSLNMFYFVLPGCKFNEKQVEGYNGLKSEEVVLD